ncbi:MAG TPA: hypothetical protein VFN70_18165 [Burkholderiales bacterium]|nr:hypothetical protein [Burkholderiales bacterium]
MAGTGAFGFYSNAQSKPWTERGEYDASRYKYNGYQGGAATERSNLTNRQQAVEERTAPQMQASSMTGAQLDQRPANQTRDVQMGSLAGLQDAAAGNVPSKAEILGKQMADRSARSRVSAAGTVRGGPGAQAAAFRSVQQGADAAAADANASIQAGRADEMATARGQLATASTSARGLDLDAASKNALLAQETNKTNATFGQEASKANVDATLRGRELNDARAKQYEDLRHSVSRDELDANIKQQEIAARYGMQGDQLNTQTNQKNADRNWSLFTGLVGAGQGVIGGVGRALSDPDAKTPISGSLASLGLGGTPDGSGGTVDIGSKGFASADDIQRASAGSDAGFGMVGGGGLTGGGGTPGGVMSDEKAKEPPQTWGEDEDRSSPTFRGWLGRASKGAPEKDVSPGKAITTGSKPKPERTWLDDFGDETKDARPFDREAEIGKPKAKDAPLERGNAPGTDDWNRYGGGEKYGEPSPGEGRPGLFEAILGGLGGAQTFGQPRDTATSDPKAKRAAYALGRVDGMQSAEDGEPAPHLVGEPLGKDEELVYGKDGPRIEKKSAAGASAKGSALTDRESKAREVDPRYDTSPGSGPIEVELVKKAMGKPQSGVFDQGPGGVPMPAPISGGAGLVDLGRAAATRYLGAGMPAEAQGVGHAPAPPARPSPSFMSRLSPDQQARILRAGAGESSSPFAGASTTASAPLGQPPTAFSSDERTKEGFAKPSTEDMADAMRSMDPAVYAYKGKFTPPDQKQGEVNVGPMANKMAADPVARTAIVRDDETGMLAIDRTKLDKVMAGSLASLQHQIDELEDDVPRAVRAKKQRRHAPAHA